MGCADATPFLLPTSLVACSWCGTSNKWWGRFVILCCCGLMLLSFWEAQEGAFDDDVLRTDVLAAEGLLLAVLVIELALFWMVHIIRTRLPLQRFATSPAVPLIEMGCIGKHRARRRLGSARSIIIGLMLLDWVFRLGDPYATGPYIEDITGDNPLASARLFVPYTTWLRPVILYVTRGVGERVWVWCHPCVLTRCACVC